MVDTKFRVFAENSQNVYSDNDYANSNSDTSSSRKFGNKSGTPVNSTLQNTALKMATMISKAVIDAIVTNGNLGLSSSIDDLKTAILNGIKNIEVNKAIEANFLGEYTSNDFAKLNEGNNFSVQPKYNSKKLLIETDTINNAKNATNATNSTDATNATNYKDGSTNKNIANEFSSLKSRVGVLEQTEELIGKDIEDIQTRLNNLGFKEGYAEYKTSGSVAVISNKLIKQGKFVIFNFELGGQGFALEELKIPDGFKPKKDTSIYVRYLSTVSGIPTYITSLCTIGTDGLLNTGFTDLTNIKILNSGWEIA